MTNKISINLEAASIASCLEIPPELDFMKKALQHQINVYEAGKTNNIILNLAPTGTGKTQAGLSILKHNSNRNAVYIAPTNALIEQQTLATEEFIQKADLPHIVKAASAKDINRWSNERVGKRSGEKLYNVLREPATIFPECSHKPILLVTNPDIFYYATFFAYNKLDKSNIASEFYSSFATVIFDEFHLYDAKQLVSLFFYMALSQVFGYFNHNRKIVLLTATPDPACDVALDTLAKSGVKIARIDGQENKENLIPSQTEVKLKICQKPDTKEELVSEIVKEITQKLQEYPDKNGAVILDSKDTLNRISDKLRGKDLEDKIGRIIGNTPTNQRQQAAQKQVILATSTVDVGFNFQKIPEPSRQNLDWLIFSSKDRFSFWQRIGRVGRVLGKEKTDIPSNAIAYLSPKAWEERINKLNTSGGRKELAKMLESLNCLQRPFLEVYWKSEAFLEIAKPLLELENVLTGLPEENLIAQLYQTLQNVLGGNKNWNYYRKRMKVIQGAINISNYKVEELQKDWKYIKCAQNFVFSFLRANYTEDYEAIKSGQSSIESVENLIQENKEIAQELLEYAQITKASYEPLFRFRDSLFESVVVCDKNKLLLDEVGETNLDPIHLLRYMEFAPYGDKIILKDRAKIPYNLTFSLQVEDLKIFNNTCLAKLYAFKNCHIKRMQGDSIRPTNLPASLQQTIKQTLIPGVIIKENSKNRWAIAKLRKQGLDCYDIEVSDYYSSKSEKYLFFPSLSGILAIIQAGFALKCPDNESFIV